jgi:hypothetical protein
VLRADAGERNRARREAAALAGPPAAGITLYDPVPMTVTRVASANAHIRPRPTAALQAYRCLEREVACPAPARSALASGCRSDRVLMLKKQSVEEIRRDLFFASYCRMPRPTCALRASRVFYTDIP